MKRESSLLLLFLVLALLSIAVFLVLRRNPATTEETETETAGTESTASELTLTAFSLEPDAVTAITWDCNGLSASLLLENADWICAEDRQLPVNQDIPESMLRQLETVAASRVLDEPEGDAVYGLDHPRCAVTLTIAGKEHMLRFGNTTQVDSLQYFSCGDGNVYLIEPATEAFFRYGLQDLVQKETVPDMKDFIRMDVSAADRQYSLEYLENSGRAYSDSYTWFWTQDGETTTLDNDLADTFADTVRYLVWGECINYRATEEELAEYGLKAPAVTASVTYRNTQTVDTGFTASDGLPITAKEHTEDVFVLEIGNSFNSDARYARAAGSQMVYLINKSIADTLLSTTTADLLPDEVIVPDWDIVSSVDVVLDGERYTFIPRMQTVETGALSSNTDALVWSLDGEECAFGEAALALDKLYFSGYAPADAQTDEELLHIVFHRSDESFPVVELAFYSYSTEDCLTVLNGTPTVLVPAYKISALIEQISILTEPQ